MFLLDYFYGTKKEQTGQGQQDDWVLLDNNEGSTSRILEDDVEFLEKDEIPVDQLLEPKPKPLTKRAITPPPSSHSETEELRSIEDLSEDEEVADPVQGHTEDLVQNPPEAGRGQLKAKVAQPQPSLSTLSYLAKAESAKLKPNCKKQAQRQRRSDKYKSGVWSGKNNDRKCGKCY